MKTIQEIRRQNLELLIKEFCTEPESINKNGGIAEVARLCDTAPSYLSQIRNQFTNSRGNVATVGNSLARKLETGTGKPEGWMDVNHDDDKKEHELAELYDRMTDEMRKILLNHARLMLNIKKE